MATEVTLPQLGESVTEGTITAWLVDIGDTVEADQPLFELSSDKIDTEVPAPTSGVLKEIRVQVDETVDVGTVVAIIGDADEEPTAGGEPGAATAEQARTPADETEEKSAASTAERDEVALENQSAAAPQPRRQAGHGNGQGADILVSPIVRRMASEAGLDLGQVRGTGEGGRITRADVEEAIGRQGQSAAPSAQGAQPEAPPQRQPQPQPTPSAQPGRAPRLPSGKRVRTEDLSRIRQRIAAKMMESMQGSAQLTTVQEADVTRVMRVREQVKDEFKAREGVSLSPFVFLCRAAVLAIRNHPTVNALADWDAGKVAYHDYVNLGIAVDTEKGLIVPNIKGADDLSLAGLARAVKEAADKARGHGKLEIADIEGGTFTVTNTGSRGVLIDTPILNYPEVAILATAAIKKRPVVVEDEAGPAIAIRDMVYLCLTYDHRLIDGADAARFVSDVKEVVETHDWAAEIGY